MTNQQTNLAAKQLDPAKREVLAKESLLSIGEADRSEIDAAWLDEARNRDTAGADFLPVEQVIERLKNNLGHD